MLRTSFAFVKCVLKAVGDSDGRAFAAVRPKAADLDVSGGGDFDGPAAMAVGNEYVEKVDSVGYSAPRRDVIGRRLPHRDRGRHYIFVGRGGAIDNQDIRVYLAAGRRQRRDRIVGIIYIRAPRGLLPIGLMFLNSFETSLQSPVVRFRNAVTPQ